MTEDPSHVRAERVVPILAVSDILRTVDFYVDGLGFKKAGEWVPEGRLKWCMLEYEGGAAFHGPGGRAGSRRHQRHRREVLPLV